MLEELRRLIAAGDEGIDLVEGALVIARAEQPDLDLDLARARFEELHARAGDAIAGLDRGSRRAVDALFEHLFQREGFHGNDADYYDPRNSYLPDVLERRLGIPISLSLIFCEIARRVGLDAHGISFPGRFLAGVRLQHERVILDCHDRRALDLAGCRQLLHQLGVLPPEDLESLLAPAPRREVLARMIANLQAIAVRARDIPRAMRWTEMILTLRPDAAEPYRDRGLLAYESGDYARAAADLREYLRRHPTGFDVAIVKRHLIEAQARIARES